MFSWVRRVDIPLLLVVLALGSLGLLLVYSASNMNASPQGVFTRHALHFSIGLLLLALFWAVDYEFWGRWHWVLYTAGLVMLVLVLVAGTSAGGARRWLDLGSLGAFQPSELMKLLLLISLCRLLATGPEQPRLLPALALIAIPAGLVLLEPDLGTAAVLIMVALVILLMAGARFAPLAALVGVVLVLAPLVLKDYQRERLTVFLHPDKDPTGAGWNLIQAQIAVGSGELWGKGLFQGLRKELEFVPERHTDFIFTVVGEETGLVGGLAILALYLYIVYHGLAAALVARDRFGSLLAVGVAASIALHVLINVGMVLGLAPITGLPLPLLSYGGSSLLTNMMMLGLLASVWSRRRLRPQPLSV